MDSRIIEIKGLEKKYSSKFSLSVDGLYLKRNKILTIIGPNGSGKSTLIRLLDLLEKPDSGVIFFNGKNILDKKTDRAAVRKKIAVVFQEPLLFNTSVYSNIIMGLKFRKIALNKVRDRLEYFTEKLKIGDILGRSVKNLSGGEKQRVSLARALILDPQLLLLDEPLANIDQQSRESLRSDLFEVLKRYGKSIIYVTHDRNEAMILADYMAVMNEGRIEQFAPREEVFRKPANEFIAKFVGIETLIEGTVVRCSQNVAEVEISNGKGKQIIHIVGNPAKGKRVTLAIRPEDVILYRMNIPPGKSSAMNLFEGKITGIRNTGMLKKIEMDCGFDLISFVTQNSIERLGLDIGKTITAGIKASSIHMF
ncbi:MAG: ABC transporter ATP-binding protein [Actinobacteria bacterium]|nr:ABC transporter ATP-binding protein [Actinomycetota bacterium]